MTTRSRTRWYVRDGGPRCPVHNSPLTNGDAAPAWRRSFTKLVCCAVPSRCETFAVANPAVAARKGNSMIVSTWFDGKGESCASCSFLGSGKGAFGSGQEPPKDGTADRTTLGVGVEALEEEKEVEPFSDACSGMRERSLRSHPSGRLSLITAISPGPPPPWS